MADSSDVREWKSTYINLNTRQLLQKTDLDVCGELVNACGSYKQRNVKRLALFLTGLS
jgi:hypothetical protein